MNSSKAARTPSATIIAFHRDAGRKAEVEFLPAALEVLETPASPLGRATAILIMGFFAAAIVWASLGHVDIIAEAPGKIVPTGRTKAVQPLESGIISAIHVEDGDHVVAGQPLIELDPTVTNAERTKTLHDLRKSKLDVARLSALRATIGGAPLNFAAPSDIDDTQIMQARAATAAQWMEQQQKVASVERQIAQKNAEAEEGAASIAKIEASLPLLKEEFDVRDGAFKIAYGNKIAYLEIEEKLTDQQNELTVEQRHAAEITAAREALERQKDQTEAEYAQKVLTDLADAEQKVSELTQDLIKSEQKADERILRAPVNGTVQELSVHTVGGVVTPAQQLMLIVPEDSHLEIEAMVSNQDIGFVRPGQIADIKVDTFNFTRYGLLRGTVLSVSQDAVISDKGMSGAMDGIDPQKASASPDTTDERKQGLVYQARVSVDNTRMQVEDKIVNLEPGMGVTVEIKTGSRRVIQYLISPLLRYRHESLTER
jgi:hemolysin D